MKLTPTWRNRLRNLTTIFLVLTVVAIIYTLIQWIRSEPGSFEPLNALFFAVFPVLSALSAWLTRPANVQPPANIEIAMEETLALGPLRQQITELFSLEDIRVLCLDLGIYYDDLRGNTISAKSASLLAYANRRGQLSQLMSALRHERPQAIWLIPSTLQQEYDLRRNVQATWIDGVLKQSVVDEISLELRVSLHPHALMRKVAYVPGIKSIPIEKGINTLLAEFGSLLVLGEPGCGKTMTLLELAENSLQSAEQDASLPTPVIFNLSSWAVDQKPLNEWFVEELWQQYQLTRKTGRTLIQSNRLLYLLDGLDEVTENARLLCVEAINKFKEHYPSNIVVCCRTTEYEALPIKLNLGMGIRILPLRDDQVENYLRKPDLNLQAIYNLWQTDSSIRELAQTPLFLSVLAVAYQNNTSADIPYLHSSETRLEQLYRHYVKEMFRRRPIARKANYNEAQALNWVTNLAYNLQEHEQTLFYIERLQPSWLPTVRLRRQYKLSSIFAFSIFGWFTGGFVGWLVSEVIGALIFGFIGGLVGGLIGGLIVGLVGVEKPIKLYEELKWSIPNAGELFRASTRGLKVGVISGLTGGFIGGYFSGPYVGLIYGLIGGFIGGLESYKQSEVSQSSDPELTKNNTSLLITLFYGLIVGLIGGAVVEIIVKLNYGIISGLLGGILGGVTLGLLGWGRSIHLYNTLNTYISLPKKSFSEIRTGLLIGLIGGLISGMIFGLTGGLIGGLIIGLVDGLLFGLETCIKVEENQNLLQPNQGIRSSFQSGILMTLFYGLIIGIISGIIVEISVRFTGEMVAGRIEGLLGGLIIGLIFGLVNGFAEYGGHSFVRHYILRWILKRNEILPFAIKTDQEFIDFLDEMKDRILLRRVGGGWIFIHRTLLEYFASLHPDAQVEVDHE